MNPAIITSILSALPSVLDKLPSLIQAFKGGKEKNPTSKSMDDVARKRTANDFRATYGSAGALLYEIGAFGAEHYPEKAAEFVQAMKKAIEDFDASDTVLSAAQPKGKKAKEATSNDNP